MSDGVERRKGYAELQKQLEDHTWEIERRFHRWFVLGLVAFAIIGLSSVIALAGFGVILQKEQDQNDRIQQQRKDFVLEGCEDQNTRNANTKEALKKGSTVDIQRAQTPAMKKEIARRRDVTYAIIDAVMPVQDCQALADSAVQRRGE